MKFELHGATPLAVAVLSLLAQGVCAAPTEKNVVKTANSALIKQTSVSAAKSQKTDTAIAQAASAARRDNDPEVNGSVGVSERAQDVPMAGRRARDQEPSEPSRR